MATRRSGSLQLWQSVARLVLGLSALALIAFVVWRFTKEPDDMLSFCGRLIPGEKASSFKIEKSSDGVPIISASASSAQDTKDALVLEKLISCPKIAEPVVVQDISAPAEPLGQIANRWNRDGPIAIRLDLSNSSRALQLNNLRMSQKYVFGVEKSGAAKAHATILSSWCAENSRCLVCQPTNPKAGDSEIVLRLKADAPLLEAVYPGGPWTPKDDGSYEPWQYVKAGTRYVFVCQ